jgi:hypothetical protein
MYEYGKDERKVKEEAIKGNYNVHIINPETEEVMKATIDFQGKDIYLCEYFDNLTTGIYNIEIYPTNNKQSPLILKDMYINEYGISRDEYLTKDEKFIFAFSTNEKASITLNIEDGTFNGLDKIKNNLDMYQTIETSIFSKDRVQLKLVGKEDKQNYFEGLSFKNNSFKGALSIPQNKRYDI